jgi:hypothetical protein
MSSSKPKAKARDGFKYQPRTEDDERTGIDKTAHRLQQAQRAVDAVVDEVHRAFAAEIDRIKALLDSKSMCESARALGVAHELEDASAALYELEEAADNGAVNLREDAREPVTRAMARVKRRGA